MTKYPMIALAAAAISCLFAAPDAAAPLWSEDITIDRKSLAAEGRNPYMVLEPGYRLSLVSPEGKLVITVLDKTRVVDGVLTRVVEEREWDKGRLVEVSRNYFAISRTDKTVYYFGEDVDMFNAKGQISGHGGSWLAGKNGTRAGVMIPGKPATGARYYQELAPKVAMDRAEVIATNATLKVPAGTYTDVLKTEETSKIEAGKGYKYYAPGIGLLKDDEFELVSYGKTEHAR